MPLPDYFWDDEVVVDLGKLRDKAKTIGLGIGFGADSPFYKPGSGSKIDFIAPESFVGNTTTYLPGRSTFKGKVKDCTVHGDALAEALGKPVKRYRVQVVEYPPDSDPHTTEPQVIEMDIDEAMYHSIQKLPPGQAADILLGRPAHAATR